MAGIRWSGRLTPAVRVLVGVNSSLAWIVGTARDTDAMKQRVKSGYDGETSDAVTHYDELCWDQYGEIAAALLAGIDVRDLELADLGCGTGAAAFAALDRGAKRVACTEVSSRMLARCRDNARMCGHGDDRVAFHLLGGADSPVPATADVVLSSMVLGLVPDQLAFIRDAMGLARDGGTVAVATHGPEFDWEAVDATFRAMPKRFVLGYRVEFWPLTETDLRHLLETAGLSDVRTTRRRWDLTFRDTDDAYDFFCASSSAYWWARVPEVRRDRVEAKLRDEFRRRGVHHLTHDIVFGYGRSGSA